MTDTAQLVAVETEVARLRAEGYGDTALHPHIPTVLQTIAGPVLGWQVHCTGTGCGIYVDDARSEAPADFLCEDCEDRS